ncbi:Propanediol utilization protein [Alkaliphilus metalliredigens QYMF]|uniref:Phosphate propanoyltransferase n=1 Tax=Alkaliphilus metalliredigens (strain QYMF) TaxID=293826 RepID=PDUL_ALKMQ|nr:phosphate propanoyltransferase [Alkaliphilus metalliredigens]A6TJX7.1 RecName: Full=Phosphate propanoyltransferase; AltName: Full=Phosphate acyltransferase PduL; AltName: Full=Phosphotransacylase PduL; Short=PTAC; AltName: Full=Propanediol utilization protein PduL [Alkaliphilus metalliredigens QYMF]ABR46495.1 Propanediol utilization protein [Alkaliphilus metalliredigens QYMF]
MKEEQIKQIVEQVIKTFEEAQSVPMEVPVEVSARHIHLSKEHISLLFGSEDQLSIIKELSQPGQFQYDKRVTLIGPKGSIGNVAILGPSRDETQVEISYTDARALGIKPPLRESGDLQDTAGIIIATGHKAINLEGGVMIAKRHIHMTPKDAEVFHVKDGEHVKVRIESKRPIVLEDVLVRVNEKYGLSMHIDHDEGNAAAYQPGTTGKMIK